jgi:hypothetical protein
VLAAIVGVICLGAATLLTVVRGGPQPRGCRRLWATSAAAFNFAFALWLSYAIYCPICGS